MTSAASKITIRLRICLAVNCVIIMEFSCERRVQGRGRAEHYAVLMLNHLKE